MKTVSLLTQCSVALFAVLSVRAQATFQNLNFEQASPISAGVPGAPYIVTAASALPYWTVTIGGVQQTQINYNAISTGAPAVVLIGVDSDFGSPPIDGNYSVLLQGSFPAAAPAISQTSLIPAGTQSLLFEALPSIGSLNILVGAQIVPFADIGSGPNYTLYDANISAWADDVEQITFSALGNSSGPNNWEIDDISFSPTPEPSVVSLAAIGGLLFASRKWFARRC
jgi:hypothetical protein